MNKVSTKRIAIIGAGPGGLSAGMLLTKEGFDVNIFEAQDNVGGRNGCIEKDGFTFDLGPTFFMMPFVLEEIFKATGRNISDYLEIMMMDPFYQLVFSDGKVLKTSFDPEKFRNSIAGISPKDAMGYEKYMKENKKKFKYTLPVLQRPFSRLKDLLNIHILKLLFVLNPQRSIWSDLGRFFSDGRVKVGFTFQSKYLGMSPFKCPSMFSILPFIEYNWGIYHVKGGLNKLSKAMAKVIEEEGGKINVSSPVKEIVIENEKAVGIKLKDNEILEFDEIIMNSDFAWSMKNIIPNEKRKKYSDDKLDKKNYSCSTFMLYLGLDREYPELEHHNVFIAKDYEKNFLEIESMKELSKEPSFYVQNASKNDDSLAPDGHSTLYVLVPVANLKGEIDWDKEKEGYKEIILSKMDEKFGNGKIREHIIYEKVITPKDWHDDYRVGYGATFNLGHNLNQMLVFRPHNNFEEFDNLWLVGGGTHPGSGLPTIYESGRITANLIKRTYGLDYSFNHEKAMENL